MRPLLGEFSALTCLCVCLLSVCVFVCLSAFFEKKKIASGPPVIFSNNIVHTINVNIYFQIKLKTSWAPKYCVCLFVCLSAFLKKINNC
jgi:hypothetical protein